MSNFLSILDKNDNNALVKIRDFVVNKIKVEVPSFGNELSSLHKFIDVKEVNDLRLKIFSYINSELKWENLILEICENELNNKHGRDLLVQSKINLSIQMPNDQTSILPIHTDSSSADSPFQTNIWIPLTDAFETNSMFILDEKQTIDFANSVATNNIDEFHASNFQIREEDFIKINFGQILFFNPSILHGNVLNETNKTRVSLNLRIKSMFSPEPDFRNADRKFGTYYKILSLSEETRFALDFLNSGYLK